MEKLSCFRDGFGFSSVGNSCFTVINGSRMTALLSIHVEISSCVIDGCVVGFVVSNLGLADQLAVPVFLAEGTCM